MALNPFRCWLSPRSFPKIRTSHVRLAVTGCSRAGKTVFLTSLINHLLEHQPDKFRLAPENKKQPPPSRPRIVKARERRPRNKQAWNAFPYRVYREGLSAEPPKWPEKTRDRSQYMLEFEVDTSFLTRYRLSLFDLPGERLMDAAMIDRSFEEWSRDQIECLHAAIAGNGSGSGSCLQAVEEYVQMVNKGPAGGVQESSLIDAYKRAMTDLAGQYLRYISPSTFLLDERGKHLTETAAEVRAMMPTMADRDLNH